MIVLNGQEIFLDECYFHMWAVRPVGCRDFDSSMHFDTLENAKRFARGEITIDPNIGHNLEE